MLESSDIVAFSWSTDLARARGFYEHTLGLRCIEQNEFACVFDVNGTMLRVTAVPEVPSLVTRCWGGAWTPSRRPSRLWLAMASSSLGTTVWTKTSAGFGSHPEETRWPGSPTPTGTTSR